MERGQDAIPEVINIMHEYCINRSPAAAAHATAISHPLEFSRAWPSLLFLASHRRSEAVQQGKGWTGLRDRGQAGGGGYEMGRASRQATAGIPQVFTGSLSSKGGFRQPAGHHQVQVSGPVGC